MNKTMRASFTRKGLIAFLALIVGLAIVVSNGAAAYAAESADGGQKVTESQMPLTLQYTSFTTATTAPAEAPNYGLSSFEIYPTYFFFAVGADSYLTNYNLYMDVCPAKAPWSKAKTWVFHNYVQTYTVQGLKPNTKYKVRLYYGINESVIGPYSKSLTFKTGPNKTPAIKSVNVQAIKYKTVKKRAYNMNFLYWWRHPYTYTEYQYNQRVTVTFKKAPKTKYALVKYTMMGLEYAKVIKTKKGKKTYTVTSARQKSIYNPRKQKSTVSVATYQNKTWKGYSKLWSKSRKIK